MTIIGAPKEKETDEKRVAIMEFGFTTAAYVVAAILFILSLGGLSGQESANRAVWYGIVGMGLAIAATLIGPRFRALALVPRIDHRGRHHWLLYSKSSIRHCFGDGRGQ